jgi:hypothetical protein
MYVPVSAFDLSARPLTLCILCLGQASTIRDGKPLTCVWCRARWIIPAGTGARASGSGAKRSEGYINLADVSGLSPVRDTSTCAFGVFPLTGRVDLF